MPPPKNQHDRRTAHNQGVRHFKHTNTHPSCNVNPPLCGHENPSLSAPAYEFTACLRVQRCRFRFVLTPWQRAGSTHCSPMSTTRARCVVTHKNCTRAGSSCVPLRGSVLVPSAPCVALGGCTSDAAVALRAACRGPHMAFALLAALVTLLSAAHAQVAVLGATPQFIPHNACPIAGCLSPRPVTLPKKAKPRFASCGPLIAASRLTGDATVLWRLQRGDMLLAATSERRAGDSFAGTELAPAALLTACVRLFSRSLPQMYTRQPRQSIVAQSWTRLRAPCRAPRISRCGRVATLCRSCSQSPWHRTRVLRC